MSTNAQGVGRLTLFHPASRKILFGGIFATTLAVGCLVGLLEGMSRVTDRAFPWVGLGALAVGAVIFGLIGAILLVAFLKICLLDRYFEVGDDRIFIPVPGVSSITTRGGKEILAGDVDSIGFQPARPTGVMSKRIGTLLIKMKNSEMIVISGVIGGDVLRECYERFVKTGRLLEDS